MNAHEKPKGNVKESELSRLKKLPSGQRETIWEWRSETDDKGVTITNAAIRHRIAAQFGIRLSGDYQLSRFWKYQRLQMRAEGWNERQEQFQKFYQEQNPNASRDQVRQAAIAFFMMEAADAGDRDGFVEMANLDLKDKTSKTKAEIERQKLEIADRRTKLLERKAEAYDQAKGILSNQSLSEDEKKERMHQLFGI